MDTKWFDSSTEKGNYESTEIGLQQLRIEYNQLVQEIVNVQEQANKDCQFTVKPSALRPLPDIITLIDQHKIEFGAFRLKQKVFEETAVNHRNVVVDEESIMIKRDKLRRLEEHATKIVDAIITLEDGIQSTQLRTQQANNVAFNHVQRELQEIFQRSVPSKSVNLTPLGSSLEKGVTFTIKSSTHPLQHQHTKELSGGQLTMLGT